MRTLTYALVFTLVATGAWAKHKKHNECLEFEWGYEHANACGEFPKSCDCVEKE